MSDEEKREEFERLNLQNKEMFGLPYFPPIGCMTGYTEPLDESIEKLKHALETGERIEPPKVHYTEGAII